MGAFLLEHLRVQALPALRALFRAYEDELRAIDDMVRADLQLDPELEGIDYARVLRSAFDDRLYALAGCIFVVGDSITKTCAIDDLLEEDRDRQARRYFGNVVANGVRFGAALQAGLTHFDTLASGGR